MESFLNILWVLIALCALGAWQVSWVHQERRARRNPIQEWTAFICALVLLFFAVSLTDDLHSELVLFDECASGRRYSTVCSCGHPTVHGARTQAVGGAAILPRVATVEEPLPSAGISPVEQVLKPPVRGGFSSGRAPPVSYL
jgi:hypothetical protein